MSFPQLVGCGPVGCVVGAEALGEAAGVWVKARFYRDGNFLCATVYSVAAGEPRVVELRVDIRPIARAIMRGHSALHAQESAKDALRSGSPAVGWSLGSMWRGAKKAAKAIGRTKLVKGVVAVSRGIAKAGKAVIKSKITAGILGAIAAFPLTAPFGAPVLAAYATAHTAISGVEAGAKVVKTAQSAASVISRGTKLAAHVTGQKTQTASVVQSAGAQMSVSQKTAIAARAKAAGQLKLTAQGKAKLATAIAKVPAGAARLAASKALSVKLAALSRLRTAAVLAKNLPAAASAHVVATTKLELSAGPAMANAAATAKRFQDPTVRKRLVDIKARGDKAQALLQGVADKAKTGDLDASKSAAIINLVARNRARIQAMSQVNAGGLPGVLITPQGKLVRGRFRVQATAAQGGLLYQGRGATTTRGTFATVAGMSVSSIAVNGRGPSRCYAINGDLPLDGVRLAGRGANASELGRYEDVGCDCSSS